MAKTQEELNALKEEVETLDEKLHELTEEELEQVTGGNVTPLPGGSGDAFVIDKRQPKQGPGHPVA